MKKTLNTYSVIALGGVLAMSFASTLTFGPSIAKAQLIADAIDQPIRDSFHPNVVSNGLPNPSAMVEDEPAPVAGNQAVGNHLNLPTNPPPGSNNLPNPSATLNNPQTPAENNNSQETVAPRKKRRSGGGHTSIVRKPVAASAPVVAAAPVVTSAPVAVVPSAPVVKSTVAAAPVKTEVAATPEVTPEVAATPATTDSNSGSNLAASASQSFGSRFVNFFVKLWNCAFGNECR